MFVASGCVIGDGNDGVLIIHGLREYTSQFWIYRISEYLLTSIYQFTFVNCKSIQFDICQSTLGNTEGSIEHGQSRGTDKTRRYVRNWRYTSLFFHKNVFPRNSRVFLFYINIHNFLIRYIFLVKHFHKSLFCKQRSLESANLDFQSRPDMK